MVIISSDFLIFDQIFLSPQVKRSVVISNKHGKFGLPHGLPNDLSLRPQLWQGSTYEEN